MATATDLPTLTVVGKIGGVGDANEYGFANIKVETGSGDLWVSTKSPGLIEGARTAKAQGNPVSVDYITKEGKINPKTGRPFLNSYLQAIRQPAADELPSRQYSDDDIPFGQEEDTPLEVTVRQEMDALRPSTVGMWQDEVPSKSSSQDEFRRSKEEMRWTEALHIAAVAYGGQSGVVALSLKADEIYALLERGPGK